MTRKLAVDDRQMIHMPDGSFIEGPRLCPLCGHSWMPEHRSRDEGCQAVVPGYDGCGCAGPDEWRE